MFYRRGVWSGLCLTFFLLLSVSAQAHRSSDAFLQLQPHLQAQDQSQTDPDAHYVDGRYDLFIGDWDLLLALDTNADGDIRWGEIRSQQAQIKAVLGQGLQLSVAESAGENACQLIAINLAAVRYQDENYLRSNLRWRCPGAQALRLHYSLFEGINSAHRMFLQASTSAAETDAEAAIVSAPVILAPGQHWQAQARTMADVFMSFFQEGLVHIAIGYDHILFLCCVLLGCVVHWQGRRWQAKASARACLLEVLALVTAFTLAHTLTLALAVFGVLRVPTQPVEILIAASVLFSALNLMRPVIQRRMFYLVFAFGLLHGLGFAAVVAELELASGARAFSLLAFNLGVEAGQLVLVALLMPLLLWLRHRQFYREKLQPLLALSMAGVAFIWMLERVSGSVIFG